LRTLTVQAYEDQSRAEGGHAVIVVRGLDAAVDKLSFRIRPLEAGRTDGAGGSWLDGGASTVSKSQASDGIEFLVGPEIVESELLMPGTVVEIEIPEAGARGEFLWPSVAPMLRPKRRNIVLNRGRKAGKTELEAEPVAAAPTPAPVVPEVPVPAPASQPQPISLAVAPAAAAVQVVSTSTRREDRAMPVDGQKTSGFEAAAPASTPLSAGPAAVAGAGPRAAASIESSATDAITASQSWYQSARGSHMVANEPAPSQRPQMANNSLAATFGILLATLAAVYMLSRSPSRPVEPAAPASHTTAVSPASPTATQAVVAAPAAAPSPFAAVAVPPRPPVEETSLFDLLATSTTSPRGVSAAGVSAAKSLEHANAQLQGPNRDTEEAGFWLRRYLQASLSEDRMLRVMTQLGSTYAEPDGARAPDYVKARLLWEMASAAGDPVAMCFLGLVHEHGLGVPASRSDALHWFERSKKSGGCPHIDESIARVKQ